MRSSMGSFVRVDVQQQTGETPRLGTHMDAPSFTNLLAVAAIAFAAPFLLGSRPASVALDRARDRRRHRRRPGRVRLGGGRSDDQRPGGARVALIAAGLLSVMIFPLTGLTLLRRAGMAGEDGVEATVSA